MESALRPTGIEGIGPQPWGTHFCLFYETKEDLLELLIPYFKAGLENHEFCLCIASEPVIAEEAGRALKDAVPDFDRHRADEQIEIISHLDWYLPGGHFDPLRVRQGWIDKLEQAQARGYAGMRFAANVFWLERQDWDSFADYEAKLDEAFGKLPILAACAYSLTRCSSADILDVVRHHQFALARRHGAWEGLEGPELQRALAEIRRLNADLERRVEDRTAQLAATIAQLKKEIDERRLTEEALRESEQRLQSVLATLPVGVAVTDLAGDILLVNAASKRIWGDIIVSGRERRERSKGFWHESGKKLEPDTWASMRALREGQTTLNELIDIESFDGQKKTIQNSAAPIRNAEGSIVGAVVVNEDVTERVRAEDQLRRAEDELHLVINTILVMAWTVRPDGVVDFLNQRWLNYTGLSLEQYVVDPTGPIHPEDIARVFGKWRVQMAIGEAYDDEMRLRRADGEYRWFLVRTAPLRDEQGNIVKWYGVSIDIEDRKRAEATLRESGERLQHLSRRLLKVQEEERRHLARELHDEFGQLLATVMLHLHAVKGGIGETALSRVHECMALLRRAGEQVRSLALRLRPVMLESAGLEPAVRWLAEQHQRQTGITTEVVGHVNGVSGDLAVACFRVAQEALTNVVRHARAQHVWIELTQGESVLQLIVRDDGVGFDVERTLRQGGASGGLGLLGMRERVEVFGGSLVVGSAPGRGTRVLASFPLSDGATESAGHAE
jgi:PAS domain S-box-containing protein